MTVCDEKMVGLGKKHKHNVRGAALLVVLFIVMAITVLAFGFLARSDIELACGQNMELRTAMDYLAESGLQHARGLILNPQDAGTEDYWKGDTSQQLVEGSSDYYDVAVTRLDPCTCNYQITSEAYRLKGTEKIGRSSLTAELRLDPAVAYCCNANTTIAQRVTITGDVNCAGNLTNTGIINGDVFANNTPTGSISGQCKSPAELSNLSFSWPNLNVNDFSSNYYIGTNNYSVQVLAGPNLSGNYNWSMGNPAGIYYYNGNVYMAGNVNINGMLVVNGNLQVDGSNNVITAVKNFPALLVSGDVIMSASGTMDVNGLAVVNGQVLVSGDNGVLSVVGGLYTKSGLTEYVSDYSGNGNIAWLRSGPVWQASGGKIGGALRFDGIDDYLEVENESNFDITGQITVCAWIKVSAFNKAYQAIVTKGDSTWRIQRSANSNYIEFACTGLSHNGYGNVNGTQYSVNDGQWHHVAGVYDGTKIYLYIDGNRDISVPTSGSINTNNYKVLIGENAQQPGRNWNGMIDDVRVYRWGLSAAEIATVKSGGIVGPLAGYWKLDGAGCGADITAAADKSAIQVWLSPGTPTRWSPAAGAFFRSIRRP